ncbi:Protein of unknown function DUF131 [Ferroglobus placidus DSM 10642]|uniref:DUF131 domain-containing protein n=1 Tax=Ferroglobus placidus (strain DSM 10642 / AEDII12DO) TaxID=589924 RepID=D3RZ33_FERPA|nr:DUF131 domain-containing protein [Ferroglobus placidus]ADC65746.1 Protein of unknown function DUF131 [Ferroglobus placidus DSM 10642]
MNPVKVFSGIALIFLGFTLLLISQAEKAEVEYGGVVIIGPIPIVFGSSVSIITLVVLLAALLLILFSLRW